MTWGRGPGGAGLVDERWDELAVILEDGMFSLVHYCQGSTPTVPGRRWLGWPSVPFGVRSGRSFRLVPRYVGGWPPVGSFLVVVVVVVVVVGPGLPGE